MSRNDVRCWQVRDSWSNLVISGYMHRLSRRYLLEHDRSCQLYVVFRRMDYVWTRIDLLFSHEGLSSWHMEDYG